MRVKLDINKAAALGWLLSIYDFPINYYCNELFYPVSSYDDENILNYFLFMVLMDYNFPDSHFYGYIDDVYYSGSLLFWRLGKIRFDDNPEFFSLDSIASLKVDEFRSMFNIGRIYGVDLLNLNLRVQILREVANKILKDYNGSFYNLIDASSNYLYCNGSGFIERLSKFRGFNDPVEYKSLLLAKILFRRGFLSLNDIDNFHVPVESKILVFSLRFGLIYLDDEFMDRFLSGLITLSEDYALRIRIREGLDFTSKISKKDSMLLHDFLDMFTSYCCKFSHPKCVYKCDEKCSLSLFFKCDSNCLLRGLCRFCGTDLVNRIHKPAIPDSIYY
ncbi:MAG: hypothetical protein QW743_07700 [Candidatus Methanomethylicia archaeon]